MDDKTFYRRLAVIGVLVLLYSVVFWPGIYHISRQGPYTIWVNRVTGDVTRR